MEDIMDTNSTRILLASLRFFRTDEPFERLWQKHISFLIAHAEIACTNLRGLGSITRIIWNQSPDNNRAFNIRLLLLTIWQGCLDDKESPELRDFERQRISAFRQALVRAAPASRVMFASWDQVAVRNLISESIAGFETKGAVTRRFCKDLAIQPDELIALLAISQE
jgi:hypothetical protein